MNGRVQPASSFVRNRRNNAFRPQHRSANGTSVQWVAARDGLVCPAVVFSDGSWQRFWSFDAAVSVANAN